MSEVISDLQRQLNARLHQQDASFGNRDDGAGAASQLPQAILRMHQQGLCNSMLDYGTGKGALVQRLRQSLPPLIQVHGYDPSVAAYSTRPAQQVDILTCLDVLEHVEIDCVDSVLRDIKSLTKQFCYLVVDLQPAIKTLADGRNAHVMLAPTDWWVSRIAQLFACQVSFPLMHQAGIPQKVVIAATDNPTAMPAVYEFLNIINLWHSLAGGCILQGVVQQKKSLDDHH
jgi:hypothetical protein